MPDIDADGCMIHAEVEGPERAPVLMLSNSLGTNLHMCKQSRRPGRRTPGKLTLSTGANVPDLPR